MIYVGIDIAKQDHFASAISSDGVELMKPFKFTNDGDGFQMLISRLADLFLEDDSIIIGHHDFHSWSPKQYFFKYQNHPDYSIYGS